MIPNLPCRPPPLSARTRSPRQAKSRGARSASRGPSPRPDTAGSAGRVGLGIDWHLTEHVVLQTEASALITADDFETPDEGAIDDLDDMSIRAGLQYRF